MKNWASRIRTKFRIVFLTKRGIYRLTLHVLASFGLISAVIQFTSALYPSFSSYINPLTVITLTVVVSLSYGFYKTWPKSSVSRTFQASAHEITVTVKVGNLLDYDGQIVVGFSDTFDTNTDGDKIIHSKSLQGQLLTRLFNNDSSKIDAALKSALSGIKPEKIKSSDKKAGKLMRYPIGTVGVLETDSGQKVYAVAYSTMNGELLAESSVHNIWESLGQLWNAVYTHGQQQAIAMPLVGTGLARISYLDRESMLRMTLLSFVARSREKHVCDELTVYIHPSDQEKINMLELAAFLKTL